MANNAKNTLKHSEKTTYTCLEAFEKCFENTILCPKIWFSAQMSNNAKKNHETLRKHQLNMFWGFWKFSENLVLG